MFLSKELDKKLAVVFEKYNKKLFESLPTDEELQNITFTDDFKRKMQKLINAQKKSYYYMINTVGKRVAIIILAILITLTATTFGVEAIRKSVIEFITETFEKFTKISVQNDESDSYAVLVKTSPQYIPEGYVSTEESSTDTVYRVVYTDAGGSIIDYTQQINYGVFYNIDTEDIEYEKIIVNSFDGIKYVKNGINSVVFADETYMYTINGQVPFDELIKMARSIKTE